ncbi:MAG: hypothetical protein JWN86_4503 [Planctomycetota bacterium]|nr:hypothetical protein [Planctomycetota bacterium]
MARLSTSVSGSLRLFAFFIANGTLCDEIMGDIDYDDVLTDPSTLERMFAIFANVLELDDEGRVLNDDVATRRAAQWLRKSYDRNGYVVEPAFEPYELELHRP